MTQLKQAIGVLSRLEVCFHELPWREGVCACLHVCVRARMLACVHVCACVHAR